MSRPDISFPSAPHCLLLVVAHSASGAPRHPGAWAEGPGVTLSAHISFTPCLSFISNPICSVSEIGTRSDLFLSLLPPPWSNHFTPGILMESRPLFTLFPFLNFHTTARVVPLKCKSDHITLLCKVIILYFEKVLTMA